MKKVIISKILKMTAGHFHCWCDSNVGIIRKENKNIPLNVWNDFIGIKKEKEPIIKLKWYQKLWRKIKEIIKQLLKWYEERDKEKNPYK